MVRGLFDSFNARPVEPEKIGRSFVYNTVFQKLISNNNSVVIGPRGSGKTTYFKMLTLPALMSWKGQQRNKIVRSIDFLAIYVPTDFSWFPDFRHPVGLFLDPVIDQILSYARFRNSVLRRIVSALQIASSKEVKSDNILNKFYIDLDEDKENQLATLIANSWDIELNFNGFHGLIDAINKRNQYVQRLISASYYQPDEVKNAISTKAYLHDRIFDDLRSFADNVEGITKNEFKWAICFDEVEIAPENIKQEIWTSLRSFDQRFVIKLSASPYDDTLWRNKGPNYAMKDNDYQELWLTLERGASLSFSEKIFSGICSEFGISPERQKVLLGSSYYDDDFDMTLSTLGSKSRNKEISSNDRAKKYNAKKDSFYSRKFESLAEKDSSFASFLDRANIEIEKFPDLTGNRRAFVRKFISTVVIRDAYFREFSIGKVPHLKSKKAIDRFFTGKTTLFTICEGNPRWLLVVLRPMLEEYASARDSPSISISREKQARCLEDGVSTLLSILSTISSDLPAVSGHPTLVEIIERAGDFFFEEVLGKEFVPEPTLSFVVDDATDETTLNYIGEALNQGALMLVPGQRNPRSIEMQDKSSLYGQRLRISYYLAPRYRLPLVKGRVKSLSSILLRQATSSANEEQIMMDLFGEDE